MFFTKKPNIFFLSLLLLFICSCKDEELEIPYFDFEIHSPGPQDTGSGTANVFDKTWQATAYLFPYDQDTQFMALRFETYSPEGFLREELYFGNFALIEGSYSLVNNSSASTLMDDYIIYSGYALSEDDGDVVYAGYTLDHQYPHSFYIDQIDTLARTINGRFNVLFKIREENSHLNLAKLVLFEDGEFTVNY